MFQKRFLRYRRLLEARLAAILLVLAVCHASVAQESNKSGGTASDEPKPAADMELVFRLIDEQSQPVKGAKAGLACGYFVYPGKEAKKPD